jgi:hypothetical protein
MQKKIIVLISSLVLIIIILLIFFLQTNTNPQIAETVKNESTVINISEAYKENTIPSCNALSNETDGKICKDWVYLRLTKKGDFESCKNAETNFGKFMCGFMQNPTEQYCRENAYLVIANWENASLCSYFVTFLNNKASTNTSLDLYRNDEILFTKAFYLSDSKYCNYMQDSSTTAPKELCYVLSQS